MRRVVLLGLLCLLCIVLGGGCRSDEPTTDKEKNEPVKRTRFVPDAKDIN